MIMTMDAKRRFAMPASLASAQPGDAFEVTIDSEDEIGPILASAGIVGLAIGFGAQSLVKDVITGALIVLERQFSVGDVVKIGDRSGVVESLGLRTTILRDKSEFDRLWIAIPFQQNAALRIPTQEKDLNSSRVA
jgi:small-conductance mechanosensitive channel